MATINLAPGSQYAAAARQRQQILLVTSFGLVVVTAAIGAMIWFVDLQTKRQLALVEQQLKNINIQIDEREPDVTRIVEFENKIESLKQILSDHVIWTPILIELERLIPITTSLTSINLNEDSNILQLSGRTRNLDQVAEFLSSLTSSESRSTVFIDHDLSGVNRVVEDLADSAEIDEPEYEFTVNFTVRKP